ncbi:glutathione S-transferase [Aquabacterium sp. A7-Y]|uniref:glutathione S-transferase family protein n=1 Tax=Aquabacterium sp. A7-Y TaxID=1349605 RepID=UPI00223E2544|nr:glutathione S-transferase [Aquabacterium sp. A7-Y]MCW7536931.1 glutathione S-transferase [Aquabacterium sp. A7-Y]
MLTLCGSPRSNYYNKVKFALLEKGVPFREELAAIGQPETLKESPLGKVPFIRTEHGALCESQVILDYIEARWPDPALLPADLWAAAKVRELTTFLDLHLELVARELYLQAFFGGTVSDSNKARVRKLLDKHLVGFRQLAKFSPYVAGESFTQADCAAFVHLPIIARATRAVYGVDLLAEHGIDWKTYCDHVGERASAQKVTADRKADQARSAAK